MIWLVLSGLMILTARLLAARLFASDLPYWDQWDSEGWLLLKPFHEHGIPWDILFSAHNEHRIVLSRLITMTLFALNNDQWDNLVSLAANALIYAAIWSAFLAALARRLDVHAFLPFFALYVLACSSTAAADNLLSGFQNPFYLLTALTITGVWIAATRPLTVLRLLLLCVLSVAAIYTLASGPFTAPAIALAALLRWWFIDRSTHQKESTPAAPSSSRTPFVVALTLILIALFVGGVLATPRIPSYAGLGAQSALEFIDAVFTVFSWPLPGHWYCALIVWSPFVLTAWRVLRTRRCEPLEAVAFALGGWIALQSFATAFSRGHAMAAVPTRYLDIFVVGLLLNAYLAAAACARLGRRRANKVLAFAGLFALYFGGLLWQSILGIKALHERAALTEHQIEHVRRFVASGDMGELANQPYLHVPYPIPERLAMMLNDPSIRSMLPASVRAPIAMPKNAGFEPDGFFPITSGEHQGNVFGSYTKLGNANQARIESEPVTSRFPYVALDICGYLGQPDIALSLQPTRPSGSAREIRPAEPPRESWKHVVIATPESPYRVVADDHRPDLWFAFTEPVELGRLSALVAALMNAIGPLLAIFGVLFTFFCVHEWYNRAERVVVRR
ncbi:MAG TPA: hypothetical protein VF132_10590 [Rudaea sp.]